MKVPMRTLTLCAAGMVTLSACATKGYVNKRVDAQTIAQTAALDSERTARTQADEATKAQARCHAPHTGAVEKFRDGAEADPEAEQKTQRCQRN